ncbi:MAG TPA: methyltransferase domain-containing protein [Gammaproteobacteria bacterium]|nr:methyltransferase domain-containing protein [Gammaproteobacteria bacterium]
MSHIDEFISLVHTQSKRDYLKRVNEFPKPEAAKIAKQFDFDYWDGDRKFGYGGHHYDGRWRIVAERMVSYYGLKSGDKILDIGCGKGFLLYEFTQVVPGINVVGIDISTYALANAKEEIKQSLKKGNAKKLDFMDKEFDLVMAINSLHNLYCYDLEIALQEIERVGKKYKFICMDSYRNEVEKTNLLYWQLTCECFFTPTEWEWWFKKTGYSGDYGFIYFE